MDIDPKLYGKLCKRCQEIVQAYAPDDIMEPGEDNTARDPAQEATDAKAEKEGKPLDNARAKAMKRMDGIAVIITPAANVKHEEVGK